jgi:hypothetical protein
MIVATVKFMLHDSLACKRAYGGGYLLGRKRQAYFVGKTSNLPRVVPEFGGAWGNIINKALIL